MIALRFIALAFIVSASRFVTDICPGVVG